MSLSSTSSSDRFLARMLLFALPYVLLFGVLEYALQKSGETWTVARVVAERRDPGSPTLYMRGLLDQDFYRLKLSETLERRPSVLVLGSSRVMHLRSDMFPGREPDFYNAGGLIRGVEDLDELLGLTEGYVPEVVILGVDPWWLNDPFIDQDRRRRGLAHDLAATDEALKPTTRVRLLQDVLDNQRRGREPDLGTLLQVLREAPSGRLGLTAFVRGYGFRDDGSKTLPMPVPPSHDYTYVDRESSPIIERVRRRTSYFALPPHLSPTRLALLERVLRAFQARGTLVAVYLPPFSAECDRSLQDEPFWREYHARVPALCRELGVPCLDVPTTAALGMDDRTMRDGFHANETFTATALLKLLEDPRVRARLRVDQDELRRRLARPDTTPWRFAPGLDPAPRAAPGGIPSPL